MAKRWKNDLTWKDVTPESVWVNRRQMLSGAGAILSGMAMSGASGASAQDDGGQGDSGLELNSYEDITSYNNFYEFGVDKDDPKRYAGALTTAPWDITVDGLVDNPGTYSLADLVDGFEVEERIYRFRCVEAWSMVIPWNGIELKDILGRVGVRPEAKYIAFETLYRPSEMVGQKYGALDWPYREGLRLDEAMHPLTIMATGLYGKPMPNQNGAPIRLVVPWKYGFKSIKSIVRMSLTDRQPDTSWNLANAREYGFYSNVNPQVSHPRWSQATERRVGGGLFARRQPTLKFNGYENEVADLYQGMDLAKFF